jgi:hypothetical protein
MEKSQSIRVKPKTFDSDWQEEFRSVGIRVPKEVPETGYTPVNHDPMPFSVVVDLNRKRVVKRFVGVMPNATYHGHIYSWEEFCSLIEKQHL